ncbi:EAL domain-containing protein [Candidatus Coxiella mudrowiae]
MYQPQYDLINQKNYRMEVLLRWYHPELGELLPEEFISIAEQSDLIIPIG